MLSHFLGANPMIRVIVPFIVGIIVGNCCEFPSAYILAVLALVFIFLIVCQKYFEKSVGQGVALLFFFFFAGFFIINKDKESAKLPENLSHHYVEATVEKMPDIKERSIAILLKINRLKGDDSIAKVSFYSLTYFPKKECFTDLNIGDTLMIQLQFLPLKDRKNPYVFNYADYLRKRKIYSTAFPADAPFVCFPNRQFSVRKMAAKTQKFLSDLLFRYIPNRESAAFLQSIALGNRENLSEDVKEDFATAGVVHILAVSGLHVGMVFLMINFVFGFLKRKRWGRIFLVVLGVLTVWSFAFVSGLSVSVQRAAIMFTGLQLSMISRRPYAVFNTIFYAAFFILILYPLALFTVGFQLSFIAVLGIVTLMPLLNQYKIRCFWLDKIKELAFVSLAAQIAVAPVILHYFHQLPTYFLFANLLLVLLLPFLLSGTFLLLLSSVLPIVATILGKMLSFVTYWLLIFVMKIASLPCAILFTHHSNVFHTVLIYSVLFCLVAYVISRNYRWFSTLLLSVFLLLFFLKWQDFQQGRQRLFCVHGEKETSCCTVVFGNEALTFYEGDFPKQLWNFTLLPMYSSLGIRTSENVEVTQRMKKEREDCVFYNGFLNCDEKTIGFSSLLPFPLAEPVTIDYLIFSKNNFNLNVLGSYIPECVVIDASVSKWKSHELKAKLAASAIPFHDVAEDGTFILALD